MKRQRAKDEIQALIPQNRDYNLVLHGEKIEGNFSK